MDVPRPSILTLPDLRPGTILPCFHWWTDLGPRFLAMAQFLAMARLHPLAQLLPMGGAHGYAYFGSDTISPPSRVASCGMISLAL